MMVSLRSWNPVLKGKNRTRGEALNTIIAKLGTYHILANLIPGAFFGFTLNFLFGITLPLGSIGEYIVGYYFVGLIIGRISSLVTKRVFTRVKGSEKTLPTQFIEYALYSDYMKAEESTPKLTSLSDMNECYRSLLTCVWMLPVVVGSHWLVQRWHWLSTHWAWVVVILLFALFLWSYKEQTRFIKERVENANCQETVEKPMP